MLDVLYEDNHCLAVAKPAGLRSQADRSGEPDLLELAREYIKTRYNKPGNVYLGLVHRLDTPVSGVVLLARTSKAAARLSQQFRESAVIKTYLAIAEGQSPHPHGQWSDFLLKDPTSNTVRVVSDDEPGAREAHLLFRLLSQSPRTCELELQPLTGRSHQLRVQLASRGLPILGDAKYGARQRLIALDGHPRIALHAHSLRFTHPTRAEELEVVAPVPADWPKHAASPP